MKTTKLSGRFTAEEHRKYWSDRIGRQQEALQRIKDQIAKLEDQKKHLERKIQESQRKLELSRNPSKDDFQSHKSKKEPIPLESIATISSDPTKVDGVTL